MGCLVSAIKIENEQKTLDELSKIYYVASTSTDLQEYPLLKRGKNVCITRGPLAGITGKISQRKENCRLILNLSIVGRAVGTEIDMKDVKII